MAAFTYKNFFGNAFGKTLADFSQLPFDIEPLLDIQNRNIQAIAEAQQLALGGFQEIARRQGELLTQAVEETSSLFQDVMSEGTPEEKALRQVDIVQQTYETSVKTWRALTGIAEQSRKEAAGIIHDVSRGIQIGA